MDALHAATAAGYDDPAQLKTSPDLAVIRDRSDFREATARLLDSARR
jgi:hypothetical protein